MANPSLRVKSKILKRGKESCLHLPILMLVQKEDSDCPPLPSLLCTYWPHGCDQTDCLHWPCGSLWPNPQSLHTRPHLAANPELLQAKKVPGISQTFFLEWSRIGTPSIWTGGGSDLGALPHNSGHPLSGCLLLNSEHSCAHSQLLHFRLQFFWGGLLPSILWLQPHMCQAAEGGISPLISILFPFIVFIDVLLCFC